MGYKAGMLAVAVAAIAAAPAQAATTEYPSGGSHFVGDEEGWVDAGAACGAGCNTDGVWEPAAGDPPGSISARMSVLINLGATFTGTTTWTSPAFTVPSGDAVTGATFAYDRQLTGGALTVSPTSHVKVELVDDGDSTATTIIDDDSLTSANSAFATRTEGVAANDVVAGHSYRLRITTTSSATASFGVTGDENTRFDNVVLAVDQSASGGAGGGGGGGGGTTPVVSPGVTVVKSFRSDSEIAALFRRFDESTLVGHGPGGSLIPRDLCTVIGTARADRIIGTSGNDVICGLGGNDVIAGGGGIDIIDGANGNDRLTGGSGRDKLIGLRGNDRLNGNAGNDRVGGGAGKDVIRGAAGKDRLSARDRRRDVVDGGKGRDRATIDRLARGARRTKAALRRTDKVRRVERRSS
jgi:Ca2+-binding RTX toxin-like protein